jgi:hypothetical protein
MNTSSLFRVLACVALVAIVAGCAAPASAPAPAQAPAAAAPTTAPAAAPVVAAPKPLDVVKWEYPPKFNDVTIAVVGDAGHNLKPYEFWKDEFAKAGITTKIIEVPFEGVFEKEKTEFVAGTGAFDVVTFYPSYIGDFAGNGYL